jgi:hypothetical protein
MITVNILHRHTQDSTFDNRKNGALIKAMHQQQPEIKIVEENDGFCRDNQGNRYDFNSSDDKGYSRQSFRQLKEKTIKQITLQLELNNIH